LREKTYLKVESYELRREGYLKAGTKENFLILKSINPKNPGSENSGNSLILKILIQTIATDTTIPMRSLLTSR